MKRSAGDIGLAGKKQMALYANITNPLRAKNREDLARQLRGISSDYASLSDRQKQLDAEYHEKLEQAKKAWNDYVVEWRTVNPGAKRSALNDDPKFNELFDAEDAIVDEWTAAADLLSTQAKEAITEDLRKAGYDGVFLENDVGSWGRRTDAIIALDPQQVKDISNKKPTNNPDIRFSLDAVVEETKDLIAVHNLREDNLMATLELGGMPMPSIAITKNQDAFTDYGDISVVFHKSTIDPESDSRNRVYGADAWTPTMAQVDRTGMPDNPTAENFVEAMKNLGDRGVRMGARSAADLIAVAPPEYRSVSEIKADSYRLAAWDDEAMVEQLIGPVMQAEAIIDDIAGAAGDAKNEAYAALMEAAKKGGSRETIRAVFDSYGFALGQQQIEDIRSSYQDLAKVRTTYFEAKPERVIRPDEWALVAVPSDIDPALRTKLNELGVNVTEYERGNDASRLAAINSDPGLRFSVDDTGSQDNYEELQAQWKNDQRKYQESWWRDKLGEEGYAEHKKAEARKRETQKQENIAKRKNRESEQLEKIRKSEEKRLREETKPTKAKKNFRRTMLDMFSIPDGQRAELGAMIDSYADRLLKNGSLTEEDRRSFFDRMYDSGVMTLPADDYFAEGRSYLKGGRIYVSDSVVADFGDDWNDIRKRAFAAGLYLTRAQVTNGHSNAGIDVWNNDLAAELPGLFDSEETDQRTILERILQVAEEGKDEKLSLQLCTSLVCQ